MFLNEKLKREDLFSSFIIEQWILYQNFYVPLA